MENGELQDMSYGDNINSRKVKKNLVKLSQANSLVEELEEIKEAIEKSDGSKKDN